MIMKKMIVGILGLFLVSLFSVGVFGYTIVSGIVTEADGVTPVFEADVEVNCDGHIKDEDTTQQGIYFVRYLEDKCDAGDRVNVTVVSKTGAVGRNFGYVEDKDESPSATVNIAVVNVSIPEFSTIAGTLALGGASLGYISIRKKRKRTK